MLRRALLLAAAAALAAASPLAWQTPPGGTVRALAADPAHPGTVLLGTATGVVFRSADGGGHWAFYARIGDHDDWVVSALLPDRARPGRWYAALWSWGAAGGGIFASDDDGRAWRPLLLGHPVRALAQAASRPAELVAATLDGVYRTDDAGAQWRLISPAGDRELMDIESVAIDPADPQEIYVGTWHLPWKTVNGGHDWWQMRQGVIDDSDVFSITVDRAHPDTVYLSACSGIYRSDNRGNLFRKIQGIPYSARRTPALVQDPADPATIYAGTTQGLWVTRDQGANWSRITAPALQVNDVVLLGQRILLGTNFAGVVASDDGGSTFQAANQGFSSRHVAAAQDTPAGRYVAVTGDLGWGGVFRQAPDGAWQQLPALPHGDDPLGLHWSDAGLVAATAHGIAVWGGPAGPRARAPAWRTPPTAPHGPLTALASPAAGSLLVFAVGRDGLWRSDDGGAHWQAMPAAPSPLYAALALPAADGHAWLFLAGDGYVVRSDDGGRHFLAGRLSLDGRQAQARIEQLAAAGGLVLAATTRGLYASRDQGATWSLAGHGLPAFPIAAVHADGNALFALGRQVGDVYRSQDGGRHWALAAVPPVVESAARMAPHAAQPWTSPAGGVPEWEAGRPKGSAASPLGPGSGGRRPPLEPPPGR